MLATNSGESRDKVKASLQDYPRTAHIVLTPVTRLAVLFQDVGVPAYLLIDRDAKLAAG